MKITPDDDDRRERSYPALATRSSCPPSIARGSAELAVREAEIRRCGLGAGANADVVARIVLPAECLESDMRPRASSWKFSPARQSSDQGVSAPTRRLQPSSRHVIQPPQPTPVDGRPRRHQPANPEGPSRDNRVPRSASDNEHPAGGPSRTAARIHPRRPDGLPVGLGPPERSTHPPPSPTDQRASGGPRALSEERERCATASSPGASAPCSIPSLDRASHGRSQGARFAPQASRARAPRGRATYQTTSERLRLRLAQPNTPIAAPSGRPDESRQRGAIKQAVDASPSRRRMRTRLVESLHASAADQHTTRVNSYYTQREVWIPVVTRASDAARLG